MIRISLLAILVLGGMWPEQERPLWNGKRGAVVLTYDDALHTHLDNVIPLLDSLNLRATFYLSAFFPGCRERLEDWRKAASTGHELGNHTLFHPCDGKGAGREWVSPERDLGKYSMQRMLEEIQMTNVFLQALDGRTGRTFAYPCGDTKVGDSSYVDLIRNDFTGARIVRDANVSQAGIDRYRIAAYMVNGHTAKEMIGWVRDAMKQNRMIVFVFHGVGGGHSIDVTLDDHRKLLHFLKQNEKELWVAPLADVMASLK